MAVNTIANSVITAPNPNTPIIAGPVKIAMLARAAISAVINPTPNIPFIKNSGSILCNASITPVKNAIRRLTPA